jgi:hypothetical protein
VGEQGQVNNCFFHLPADQLPSSSLYYSFHSLVGWLVQLLLLLFVCVCVLLLFSISGMGGGVPSSAGGVRDVSVRAKK